MRTEEEAGSAVEQPASNMSVTAVGMWSKEDGRKGGWPLSRPRNIRNIALRAGLKDGKDYKDNEEGMLIKDKSF